MNNIVRWLLLKPFSTENRVLVFITSIVIVMFGISAGIIVRAIQTVNAQTYVSSHTRTLVQLDDLMLELVNAETGQRGYLLTGDTNYLTPYTDNLSKIPKTFDEIRVMLPATATNQLFLKTLHQKIDNKLREMGKTIYLRKTVGLPAAMKVVKTNYGLEEMNGIRGLINNEKSLYFDQIESEQQVAEEQLRQTLLWVVVGMFVLLIFMFFAYRQIVLDLRQKRELVQRLAYEASHDQLTKLPNRNYFIDFLEYAVRAAARDGEKLALLYIDFDGFKKLNDTFGHSYGDEALRTIATLFQQAKRDIDLLARLGGDEFVILVPHMDEEVDVLTFANRLLNVFSQPVVRRFSNQLGASIGISFFPLDAQSRDQLMKTADEAMYRAKNAGGHQVQFYHEQLIVRVSREQKLRNDLYAAFDRDEFFVVYQPLVHAQSMSIAGAEALIRWEHPELGKLSPGGFLPVVEAAGLMPRVTQTIIWKAFEQLAKWKAQGHDMTLSINLSAQDCAIGQYLCDDFERALMQYGLTSRDIEVELTEQSLMTQSAEEMVQKLRQIGFRISLDDFGNGYASLAYLRRFQVERIKIDKSYIEGINRDPYYERLVRAIMAMADELGLKVTAEGVERETQEAFAKALGIERLQGFYYSPPLEVDAFTALLDK